MPDKPATFKKPKPKPKEEPPKEPSPKPKEYSPKPVEKPKAKKSCFVFVQAKAATPPRERTPDLQLKFWPVKEVELPEPESIPRELTPPPPAPLCTSPLRIGINGNFY